MESEYIFVVESKSLGKTWDVEANHPDEVWGEIFPNEYPPSDCQIIDSRINPKFNKELPILSQENEESERHFWDWFNNAKKKE